MSVPQLYSGEPDLILRWYLCYRKQPLTQTRAEAVAAELGINAFTCGINEAHWHVGRPLDVNRTGSAARQRLRASAKRQYKRDVERGLLQWQGEKRPQPQDAQILLGPLARP